MFGKDIKDISMLHAYSIGFVVEDNHKDCHCEAEIEVFPIEKFTNEYLTNLLSKVRPEMNGDNNPDDILLLKNNEKIKANIIELVEQIDQTYNFREEAKTISFERGRTIPATWLSLKDYNEYNSPCVHHGDFVIIYKYGDIRYAKSCSNWYRND